MNSNKNGKTNKNINNYKDYKKYKTKDSEIIDLEIEDLKLEDIDLEGELEDSENNNESNVNEAESNKNIDNLENENTDTNDFNDIDDDSNDMIDKSDDTDDNSNDESNSPDDISDQIDNDNKDKGDSSNNDTNDEKNKNDSSDDKKSNNDTDDKNLNKTNNDNKNNSNEEGTSNGNNSNEDSKNVNDKNNLKDEENNVPKNQNNNKPSNQPNEPNNKNDSAIDNKRNQAKQKQSNNKSPKNSGSGVKDKLKNGAKNRLKNGAKNATNNSELGQKLNDTKNKIDKAKNTAETAKKAGKVAVKAGKAVAKAGKAVAKGLIDLFVSTLPWSAIILAVLVVIIAIIILFATLSPGIGGDVNEEDTLTQNYSEVDQKTLTKIQEIANKYPNSDPSLAMAIVLYPYYDTLWDGNVSSMLGAEDNSTDETLEEEDQMKDEDDPEDADIEKDDNELSEDDIYLEPFRKMTVRRKFKKALNAIAGKTNYYSSSSGSEYTNVNTDNSGVYSGKKYNLSSKELDYIVRLCQQEQGTAKGAAAEASLMANRYELYGSKFSSLYTYVKKSGWWNSKIASSAKKEVKDAVKDVLLNGNRTLPLYVDSHDCFDCNPNTCKNGNRGDICSLNTQGKINSSMSTIKNRSNYVSNSTILSNKYGSNYVFYSFPTKSSDPFGYTKSAYNKLNKGKTTTLESESTTNVTTTYSNSEDEESSTNEYSEELYNALVEYFDSDNGYWTYDGNNFNGYKKMLNSTDSDKKEELTKAIVEDLMEKRNWFIDYFHKNKSCTTDYQSAGTVEVDEALKGNILVDVKVSSCVTDSIDSCESMYDQPITLEKYVKGVTYEEIGVSASSNIEQVKAQMIAAKSYAIGRRKITKDENGNSIVTIKANTYDQDYCDIDVGCISGRTAVRSSSAARTAVDDATRKILDEAWAATSTTYIYNSSTKKTTGSYCANRIDECSKCAKGTCMSQTELEKYIDTDVDSIIADQYSSYSKITIEDGVANVYVASDPYCTGTDNDGACGIPDDQFKFYSQNDSKWKYKNFCGKNATMGDAACGPSSMAMVIVNLTNETNITPVDTMNEAKEGKYCGPNIKGTSNLYFEKAASKHGLEYEKFSVDKSGADGVAKILKNGGLVIVSVNGNSPFTSGGHYIVLRKIDENGKVYVADPLESLVGTKSYDLVEDFLNKKWINSGWWGFTSDKSKEIVAKYCTSSNSNTNGKFAENTRTSGQHAGQCMEYVEERAIEIINSATVGYENITDRSKYTKIWSSKGFGSAKCALVDCGNGKATAMKKLFKTSSDYKKPQAGAVVVWGGKTHGHIAIIEKVNDDGSVYISQSNWCFSDCEKFSKDKLTLSEIKKYGKHSFVGYIYLLQPK